MRSLRCLMLAAAIACTPIGCEEAKPPADTSSSASLPPAAIRPKLPKVSFVTATTFRRGAEKCRLLGLKDSPDSAKREKAMKFAEEWLKSAKGDTVIDNTDPQLIDPDSVRVVWFCAYDSGRYLNVELAKSLLVDVDESTWKGYKFYTRTKQGREPVNWLADLVNGADHARRVQEAEQRKGK